MRNRTFSKFYFYFILKQITLLLIHIDTLLCNPCFIYIHTWFIILFLIVNLQIKPHFCMHSWSRTWKFRTVSHDLSQHIGRYCCNLVLNILFEGWNYSGWIGFKHFCFFLGRYPFKKKTQDVKSGERGSYGIPLPVFFYGDT